MKKINCLLLFAVMSLILTSVPLFAEEGNPEEKTATTADLAETPSLTTNEPEIEWILGDTVLVNTQNNEILVKYFDYDSNQEKDLSVIVDGKTTYENVKALTEIKPLDKLSIDYILTPEGKNLAKNISVEKPESEESLEPGNVTEMSNITEPINILEPTKTSGPVNVSEPNKENLPEEPGSSFVTNATTLE
jgi:SET domain-containing protein